MPFLPDYGQFLQDTCASNEMVHLREKRLPPSELLELAKRIDGYLVQSAAYTNPDITIKTLADSLNAPVEKVSAAINKELHKTFFDLINEKRVDKAKALLNGNINKMTIEGIAYEAGFNSRASFYRAFKKHTSLTPSEYLSQLP